MSKEIYVVGMGPGEESMMTGQAIEVLEKCDVIIGYTVYLDLLGAFFFHRNLPVRIFGASRGRLSPKPILDRGWVPYTCFGLFF